MISKTRICNVALAKIRQGRINSIDDTNDNAAVTLKDHYDLALREVLESHRWNFASTRAACVELPEPATGDWDNKYQLPTDCIRLKDVNGEDSTVSSTYFEIEGRTLLMNNNECAITYVRFEEDTMLYSASFIQALACKLASLVCVKLTGDDKMAMFIIQLYDKELAKARLLDTREAGSRETSLLQRNMATSAILNTGPARRQWERTWHSISTWGK